MINDEMGAVGPWGWIGWMVAAAVGMVLAKVYYSASAVALRAMHKELEAARKVVADQKVIIAKQHQQIRSMRAANAELEQVVNDLKSKYQDVLSANDRMRVGLAAVTRQLDEEKELRDRQYQELIATKGRHGEL